MSHPEDMVKHNPANPMAHYEKLKYWVEIFTVNIALTTAGIGEKLKHI